MTKEQPTIQRAIHNREYTIIKNSALQDKRLSWKARGLLAYLLSLPDDWQVYVSELATRSPDGKYATRTGFNELKKHGYITSVDERDSAGRRVALRYFVHECPQPNNLDTNNLNLGYQDVENQPLQSTHEQSTHEQSTHEQSTQLPTASAPPEVPKEEAEQKPKRQPNGKNAIKAELEAYFSDLTQLPTPKTNTPSQCKAASRLWWQPLTDIAKVCDNDVERAKKLISFTVQAMDADGLTISSPKSILKTALGEQAKRKRNGKNNSGGRYAHIQQVEIASGPGIPVAELIRREKEEAERLKNAAVT